ncbi:hypothetical protein [Agarivorans sp. QJM3NY_33]|uniref:COG4648 family protein n=1 Tax=Agarivorans sp. QJM3NY_33 TaxID=3421432 RepID=UPI003D7D5119
MNLVKFCSGLVLLIYPLLVFIGLQQQQMKLLLLVLAAAMLLRLIVASSNKAMAPLLVATAILGLALIAASSITQSSTFLLFYPVMVNLCLLCVFTYSVLINQPVITQLAKLKHPNLDAAGERYTRKVTLIWCVFFVINGSIALLSCYLSTELWTLYNGLISYLAIGSLLTAEFCYRKWVLKV